MAGIPGYPRGDNPASRDELLKRAFIAGGTLLVGGAVVAGLPRLAASAQSPEQDAEIFNFALLLEQVQSAFYDEAAERAEINAELLEFAKVAGEHERRARLLPRGGARLGGTIGAADGFRQRDDRLRGLRRGSCGTSRTSPSARTTARRQT